MPLIIDAVNTTDNYFRVLGDVTEIIATNDFIQVLRSTGNNGVYRVSSSVYSSGHTIITVIEPIPSGSVDGFLAGGVYGLRFSQESIPGKGVLVLTPYATNNSTSLTFNGKAALNFGEVQQRNILRLLENFASSVPPTNPTIGQHWYDYTNQVTKTYVGALTWSSDINVEDGVISFKDAAHSAPNTKIFLTGTTSPDQPGVVLYPDVDPEDGMTLFRVSDSNLNAIFGVEFNGTTFTTNVLHVLNDGVSAFAGSVQINAANNSTGLNVNQDVVIMDGDVSITSGHRLFVAAGASIALSDVVVLRGSNSAQGINIQSTGGASIATFGDSAVTLAQPLIGTDFTGDSAVFGVLGVTGTGTFAGVETDALIVNDASSLADASASTLTVTGLSTLDAITAASLTATGSIQASSGSFTTLTGSGTVSLGTATVGTLAVTGSTTLNDATLVSLDVSGASTLATVQADSIDVTGTATIVDVAATTVTVTGTTSLAATSVASTLSVTGNTTLTNLTASGNVAADGISATTLSITGASTLATVQADSIDVTGTATIVDVAATTVTVTGTTSLAATDVTGTLSVTGSIDVTGTATVVDIAATTITVTDVTSLAATSVTGTLSVASTLSVAGSTTLSNLTASGTLSVTGNTTLSNLTASGTVAAEGVSATTLSITGASTFDGVDATSLTVTGETTLTDVTVSGTATIQAPTDVQHATTKQYVDDAINAIATQQNINFWMGI